MFANGFRRVLHYHLRKCGGTSMNAWLDSQVADDRRFQPVWTQSLTDRLLEADAPAADHGEAEAQLQALGRSLFFWTEAAHTHLPVVRFAPPETFRFTLLRRPVERLLSQIADWRRFGPQDLTHLPQARAEPLRDAARLDLAAFLARHGRAGLRMTCDNHMTRALAAIRLGFAARDHPDPQALFATACAVLETEFDLVGLTERHAAVRQAMAARLGLVPDPVRPVLNASDSARALAAEAAAPEAARLIAALTATDARLYEKAASLWEAAYGDRERRYDQAAFERDHAAEAVRRLAPSRIGGDTVLSVRAPLLASGCHGRDSAGRPDCAVWTGPATRSLLYLPVPPDAALEVKLWVRGYAHERQRDSLCLTIDGAKVAHRSVPAEGHREVILAPARTTRPFLALGLDLAETLTSAQAGSAGEDRRPRGVSFDRYGWRITSDRCD